MVKYFNLEMLTDLNKRKLCFLQLQKYLACKMHREMKNAYKILARKSKGTRTYG
jgi:hypothetical protein